MDRVRTSDVTRKLFELHTDKPFIHRQDQRYIEEDNAIYATNGTTDITTDHADSLAQMINAETGEEDIGVDEEQMGFHGVDFDMVMGNDDSVAPYAEDTESANEAGPGDGNGAMGGILPAPLSM